MSFTLEPDEFETIEVVFPSRKVVAEAGEEVQHKKTVIASVELLKMFTGSHFNRLQFRFKISGADADEIEYIE